MVLLMEPILYLAAKETSYEPSSLPKVPRRTRNWMVKDDKSGGKSPAVATPVALDCATIKAQKRAIIRSDRRREDEQELLKLLDLFTDASASQNKVYHLAWALMCVGKVPSSKQDTAVCPKTLLSDSVESVTCNIASMLYTVAASKQPWGERLNCATIAGLLLYEEGKKVEKLKDSVLNQNEKWIMAFPGDWFARTMLSNNGQLHRNWMLQSLRGTYLTLLEKMRMSQELIQELTQKRIQASVDLDRNGHGVGGEQAWHKRASNNLYELYPLSKQGFQGVPMYKFQ